MSTMGTMREWRCGRLTGSPMTVSAALVLVCTALEAAGTGADVTVNGHGYQLPAGVGRRVDRFGDGGPPAAREFLRRCGPDWALYWDHDLGSLRFLRPLRPIRVVDVGSDPEALGDAV